MALLNGLPVFKIKVNESLEDKEGIDFVSCVTHPAIEAGWVAMAEKSPMRFSFSEDKQILYGPILIPDKPIYRYDENSGLEYWVVFEKQVIEKLVRKLQAQKKTVNLNYQHQKDSQIKESVIQEIWLTGKNDKSKDFGLDLPEGSAMVAVHIGDKKFWSEEIKSGNVLGFSIEGFLDMEMSKLIKNKMQFITAKTDTGLEIKCDGESFTQGAEVYTEAEGKKIPVPDGDYNLENGTVMKVMGGKIAELVEVTEEQEAEQVIQAAVKPLLDKMHADSKAQIEALEAKIKEMETKLSLIPGAPAATVKTDNGGKQMTKKQALQVHLEILRKKDKQVTK
jgi:hypothetical protein